MVFEEGPWKAVSLRNVFVLNVLGVWAVLALVTAFSLATLRATDSHVRDLFSASLSEMDRTRTAVTEFDEARQLFKTLQGAGVDDSNDTKIQELLTRLDLARVNLAAPQEASRVLAEVERSEAIIALDRWLEIASDYLNEPRLIDGAGALRLESATRDAEAAVEQALQAMSRELSEGHVAGLRRFELARRDILWFSLAMAVIYVFLAFAKSRWIQRPIETAIELAEHIAAGHFATRIKTTRVKEVSRLLEALEKMQHNLRRAATADKELIRIQSLRTEQAISSLPIGLSMYDKDNRLVLCNDTYRQIYGLPEAITRPGTSFNEIIEAYCSRSERAREENHSTFYERLAQREPFTDTSILQDGRYIRMRVRPLPDGGWIDVQEDITEERKREEAVAHMARHDSLTGLPNRFKLLEHLEGLIGKGKAGEGPSIALHCIDLQRFTEINDTLGHAVGDALLRAAGARLSSAVRETDLVARMGGDEFVIVQVCKQPMEDAASLAQRIIAALGEAFDVDGHRIFTGASVGIAIARAEMTPEHLFAQADLALYRAKDDGDSVYRFYAEDMNREAHARRELEQELREALINGEFEVFYQPIVSTEGRTVKGAEALLRWRNPKRGLISPQLFIPIAEDQGLIVPIGDWILKEACREAALWPETTKISINISPIQFKSGTLVESVVHALATSGLPARRLILEITETVLVQDADLVVEDGREASCARRAYRHGRFRHRLFVAQLSAPLPLRQDQDRPLVHHGPDCGR